jgi:hypothetical protein
MHLKIRLHGAALNLLSTLTTLLTLHENAWET